jgi:hypothetical protein
MEAVKMSCYFRHARDVFEEAGISVNPSNKKQIDQAIHQIMGISYKDCSTTWKTIKQTYFSSKQKRKELVQKLKSALSNLCVER